MSHFAVLVVGQDPEYQLAPFHEFECTGDDNEFVKDLDVTEEERKRCDEGQSLTDYLLNDDTKLLPFGTNPKDIPGAKYGYATVDANGQVEKVIRRTNPDRKWDWWTVGGRYSGRLLTHDGQRVSQCRKNQVAWGVMQMEAELQAAKDWDAANAVLAPHPRPETWKAILATTPEIDKARELYHSQPAVKAFAEANRAADYELAGLMGSCEEFLCSREDYIKQAGDSAFSVFAFLKDRQWQERGKMGWFACVSDEKSAGDWNATLRAFIDSLPDDAPLTVVDCHI